MNHKILATLSLALVAAAVTADVQPAFAWKYGVNKRQGFQQNRIQSGIGNGSLNAREAHRLNRQENKLNRQEARFRASGNGLSNSERARLEREQNQISQNIYNQKHDAPNRWNSGNNHHNGQYYNVNQNQRNQDQRISQGIQSGELTGREAGRLEAQQGRFAVKEAEMRQDGLTFKERRKLDAYQDQMSQNIYNQKHDAQDR